MEELFTAAGPYAIVFVGMSGVIGWLLKDRGRILAELAARTERLLDERQKRVEESLESARMLTKSSEVVKDALVEHDRQIEKVLLLWQSSKV